MGTERLAELAEATTSLAALDAAGLADSLGGLASDVDRAVLVGDFATYVAASFARAGTTGSGGWCDDDLAFVNDWGFDLDGVEVPVAVWYGAHDRMVPFAHGEWLAGHVANAHARPCEHDGHITLVVNRLEEIVDDVLHLQ